MGGKVCKIYQKKYREKNKEKAKRYQKEYYKKNKEKLKAYNKANYEGRKEEAADYSKKYRAENADRIKECKRVYYQKNKKDIHKKIKSKIDNDPLSKTKDRLRGLIKHSIKRKGYSKKSKTYDIIQCDKEELFSYLIDTFEYNYKISWDDSYIDLVHIDHIIPSSYAETEEDLILLNHFSNLQFLYSFDNISKGNNGDWVLDLTKTKLYDIIEKSVKEASERADAGTLKRKGKC